MAHILQNQVLINGIDLWTRFGVFLTEEKKGGRENLTAIMTPSKVKDYVGVDFREQNGKKYSDALKEFAKSEGDGYINVNAELKHCFDTFPQSEYLLDHIHPNAHKGVMLYSRLVLDK